MERLCSIAIICFLWGCVADSDVTHASAIEDTYNVICREAPIEIMSSKDKDSVVKGEHLLNYFNIVQIADSLYYMYYEAINYNNDYKAGIYFAYSRDGIHWNRSFPDSSDGNNLVMPYSLFISGCFVMKVPDEDYPFRMFGMRTVKGEHGIYMWKSKDGIYFVEERLVLPGFSDTQFAGVLANSSTIRLYIRRHKEHLDGNTRIIGVVHFNLDGELLSSPYLLYDDCLYNSAATRLNDTYDLLFPTHFDNRYGDDSAYIKSYIVQGEDSKEIDCNINDWLEPNEKWVIVAPGTVKIKGNTFVAYNTRTWSHDEKRPNDGVSRYKLIKIDIIQVK